MPFADLLTLPLTIWTETMAWGREQLERQGRWFEISTRPPHPPVWPTSNQVTYENQCLRLRVFDWDGAPKADESVVGDVTQIPVLIVTPQINHSYICDYAEDQSLVRTIMAQGFSRVAATDWKSATLSRVDETLDASMESIERCIEALGGRVHLIGLCQGGWMSMIHAAIRPEQVATVTLAAAPVDFHASPGGVNWMAWLTPMFMYESYVSAGQGLMRGDMLRMGFNQLRFLERYVGNYLSLWARLDDANFVERFRRLQDWYELPQDLPGASYLRIVKALFKENQLVKGTFVCRGEQVHLSRVQSPLYMIAGSRDHITPRGQLFAAKEHVSSAFRREYVADAGHIGVFMGHHALRKVWPVVLKDWQNDIANS